MVNDNGNDAISLQPLITHLHLASSTKQCWYADDASGAGSTTQLKKWWDTLTEIGPGYGYYTQMTRNVG